MRKAGLSLKKDQLCLKILSFQAGEEKYAKELELPLESITEEDKNESAVPKDKISVCLRMEVKHLQISFEVKTKAGWRKAGGYIDARHLSTESAGGFTGCVAGVYASSNKRESSRYVDVLQLEYGNRVV